MGLDYVCWHSQARRAIDTPLTPVIMFVVSMKRVDFVPQETSCIVPCMGDKRLFLTEFKVQLVS
jgi:hypothetical protein